MVRKPNYGFERKERERAKAAKVAERVKAKTTPKPTDELAEAPREPSQTEDKSQ